MDAFSFFLMALGIFFLVAAYPAQRVCQRWVDLYFQRLEETHAAKMRAYDSYRAILDMQQAMDELLANARTATRMHSQNRQPTRHRQTVPGFIYLLGVNNEYYKIGLAQNVKMRLIELQTASPYKLELLHVIATQHAPRLEVLLQDRYNAKWAGGEWFRLEQEDVTAIASIASPITVADLDRMEQA